MPSGPGLSAYACTLTRSAARAVFRCAAQPKRASRNASNCGYNTSSFGALVSLNPKSLARRGRTFEARMEAAICASGAA